MEYILILLIFAVFIIQEKFLVNKFRLDNLKKRQDLRDKNKALEQEEAYLGKEVGSVEAKMDEIFFFYKLTRRLAPYLDRKKLFSSFIEEVKHFSSTAEDEKEAAPLEFKLGENSEDILKVYTNSEKIIKYFSQFNKLLQLCVDRINLYARLQQLSIHDALTEIYNRRYFMYRFYEEFERAKKFKLNLSFLMIDVDYFKKVNDTYGHLVGDVVLREISKLIKESIREIDFVARFGGEEFSIILLDTDKAGAIMVAERIRSRISGARIKAFDETVSTAVSVGVSSFPQNALYADVLLETADKAVYKAKTSGRNRVSWF